MHTINILNVKYNSSLRNGAITMKVLNIILIICAFLLLFIGLETPEPVEPNPSTIKHPINLEELDFRPNIEQVIDQLYPM